MRGLWGVIGLLVTLAVVGVVLRQQLRAVQAPVPALQVPADTAAPPATPAQQSQQIQQQVKTAVESAMQPRAVDDTP